MDREFGYSQMRLNYITDYTNEINEMAVKMEFLWKNRELLSPSVNVDAAIKDAVAEIEMAINSLMCYLEPIGQ